jgi:ketosteroid isomerase-like protein
MSKNTDTVQEIYALFGRADIPAILGKLKEDVEWEHDGVDHGVPWLVPRKGRAEVGGFFETLSGIEFRRFEPVSLLEGGNQVVATIFVDLVVKATGGVIRDLEAHLWTFDDNGKVARFKHLADTHQHVQAFRGE